MLWLLQIGGFLKGLPWQVYVIAGLLALNPISYCKGKSDGKQVILERLEKAEAEAKDKAAKARVQADEKAEEREQKFEAQQEALGDIIDEAEKNETNALDGLF